MYKINTKNRIYFKIIATVIVCLFTLNSIAWSYPEKFHLNIQSGFNPITGNQIRDVNLIKYYIHSLSKIYDDIVLVPGNLNTHIAGEDLDVFLDFSSKTTENENDIIPCTISGRKYYASISSFGKTRTPETSVYTEAQFKSLKETPDSPLIGKYEPLEKIKFVYQVESRKFEARFNARDIETGQTIEISLLARGVSTKSTLFEKYRETGIPKVDRKLKASLKKIRPVNRFILEPNQYGIHGIGTADTIAIEDGLKDNNIALFHEVAHSSGIDFTEYIEGEETALDEYIGEEGKDYRTSEKMRSHYALRLFQIQKWGSRDNALTNRIKSLAKKVAEEESVINIPEPTIIELDKPVEDMFNEAREHFTHRSAAVRVHGLETLSSLAVSCGNNSYIEEKIIPVFLAALDDPKESVAAASAKGLLGMKQDKVLKSLIGDDHKDVLTAYVLISEREVAPLRKLGKSATPALMYFMTIETSPSNEEIYKFGMHFSSAVLGTLIRLKDPRSINLLIELATRGRPNSTKNMAFSGLVNFGSEAVDPLIEAMNSSDTEISQTATRILGKMDDPRSTEALRGNLENGSGKLKEISQGVLAKKGDSIAIEDMLKNMDSMNPKQYADAIQKLGASGDPRAINVLRAALSKDSLGYGVRWNAIQGLINIGEPARDVLEGALTHTWSFPNRAAIHVALVKMGLLNYLNFFKDAFEHDRLYLRRSDIPVEDLASIASFQEDMSHGFEGAVFAIASQSLVDLSNSGVRNILEYLSGLLTCSDSRLHSKATMALCKIGAPASRFFIAELRKPSTKTMGTGVIAKLLLSINDSPSLTKAFGKNYRPFLILLSNPEIGTVKHSAVMAEISDSSLFTAFGINNQALSKDVVNELIKRSREKQKIRTRGVKFFLKQLNTSKNSHIIALSAKFFGELGDPSANDIIIERLKEHQDQNSSTSEVEVAFIKAAERLKDERLIPLAVKALSCENKTVRLAAAAALAKMDSDEELEKEFGSDYKNIFEGYYILSSALPKDEKLKRLARLGESSLPALFADLKSSNQETSSFAVQALGQPGLFKATGPLLEKLLEIDIEHISNSDVNSHKILLEALAAIGDPRAIDPVMDQYKSCVSARKGTTIKHARESLESCLYDLFAKTKKTLSPEKTDEIVTSGISVKLLYGIYINDEKLLKNSPHLHRLIEKIHKELEKLPEEERGTLLKQFADSIADYVTDVDNIASDYSKISSLLTIVHDNLPFCLDSLNKLDLRLEDIDELTSVLKKNNPLTRIIRLLGESEDIIGGKVQLVRNLMKWGQFHHLYKLIVEIAREKQRAAPQEILGILEVLSTMTRKKDHVRYWKAARWKKFSKDIQDYYHAGFKVINEPFFTYYVKHRNDKGSIKKFRDEMNKAFKDVGWGDFWGLKKALKRKYGFSTADEIALLAKYVQMSNLTARDFSKTYESVRSAIEKKTIETWQNEIPSSFRTLFSLKSTRTVTSYTGDRQVLAKLFSNLSGYAQQSDLTLEKLISEGDLSPDKIKSVLVEIMLDDDNLAYFKNAPDDLSEERRWLEKWYTLIVDTLKLHYETPIDNKIKHTVADLKLDVLTMEDRLEALGFKFVDIDNRKKLFRPDKDLEHLVEKKEWEKLPSYFERKWLTIIKKHQIEEMSTFTSWIEDGFDKFIGKLSGKVGDLSKEDKEKIWDAIFAAKTSFLKRAKKIRRNQYTGFLLTRMMTSFADDIASIVSELDHYEDKNITSKENLYVGFFDDMLHLNGEYMLSGVCTSGDRPRQVMEGYSEGSRFGTIALKDASGKVHAFSQVQIVKTPLKGAPDVSNNGYRVLCLTGINHGAKLPLDRKKATLAILMCAKELAERCGLQKAVIVDDSGIFSNQAEIHRCIASLVEKGFLTNKNLVEEVTLSKDPYYTYKSVYAIESLPDIELTPVTLSSIKSLQERESNLLEKTHTDFYGGFGHIVHNGELPEEHAERLKDKLEETLKDMPKNIVGSMLTGLQINDMSFNVQYEPSLAESHINIATDEVLVYLGRDVFYGDFNIESLALREIMAEAIAALILSDYTQLKEAAPNNENAFFKIENIKALLNYKSHLPLYYKVLKKLVWTEENYWENKAGGERKAILSEMKKNLNDATGGWSGIYQWRLFLNVMDDADPAFITMDYMNLLLSDDTVTEEDISDIIMSIAKVPVADKVSMASLRNTMKEFYYLGKIWIKIGAKNEQKNKFDNFDTTESLVQLRDTLMDTKSQDKFYGALRELFRIMLSLPETGEILDQEMLRLFDSSKDIFSSDNREEAIRNLVEEIITRRLGGEAFTSLKEHLRAMRGTENIPEVSILEDELRSGDDSDRYTYLKKLNASWVGELFKLKKGPDTSSRDDDPRDGGVLASSLIGKYLPLEKIGFVLEGEDDGFVAEFLAENIETGEVENITLTARRAPSGLFENYRRTSNDEIDTALRETLARVPEKQRFLLEANPYGIYGLGSYDTLAIAEHLAEDDIAIFHELAHSSGMDLTPYIQGGEEAVINYISKEGKPHRQTPGMRSHYALRLFQRMMCPEDDRDLTEAIKLSSPENNPSETKKTRERTKLIDKTIKSAETAVYGLREALFNLALNAEEGEHIIFALDEDLGREGTLTLVQKVIKELCRSCENEDLQRRLNNIIFVKGRGKNLAGKVAEYVGQGKDGIKVTPANVIMLTRSSNEENCGSFKDDAIITFIDDSKINMMDYYPIVEVAFFTIARALYHRGLSEYGPGRLSALYNSLNIEKIAEDLIISEVIEKRTITLILKPAKPFEYEELQHIYKSICKILKAA